MRTRNDRVLLVIGLFKLVKAATLAGGAFVALQLVREGSVSRVLEWIQSGPMHGERRLLQAALSRVMSFPPSKLKIAALALGAYATLFAIEGAGLLCRRRWAEFLTIIATASLIPLELYEIVQRATLVRIGALAINAAVVLYLILRVRKDGRGSETAPPPARQSPAA